MADARENELAFTRLNYRLLLIGIGIWAFRKASRVHFPTAAQRMTVPRMFMGTLMTLRRRPNAAPRIIRPTPLWGSASCTAWPAVHIFSRCYRFSHCPRAPRPPGI